jgi:hypothetical protein
MINILDKSTHKFALSIMLLYIYILYLLWGSL